MGVYWKDWWWSWNSSPLATWCQELTHWKRPWCWERLKAWEGDDRGWDGWMASPARWTWVWVNHRSWWWTGKPGVPQSMGSQSQTRLSHWTELNWGIYQVQSRQWFFSWTCFITLIYSCDSNLNFISPQAERTTHHVQKSEVSHLAFGYVRILVSWYTDYCFNS